MNKVLVVLTNWKRPQNMPACIRAWKEQSVPTHVVVVDNSPSGMALEGALAGVHDCVFPDDTWRIFNNLGPPCRFAPALCLFQHPYTLFADDDFLPGREAIETCIKIAASMGNKFATIGQHGRMFQRSPTNLASMVYTGKWTYQYGNPVLTEKCLPVHMTVRCHFVRTSFLRHVLQFRNSLTNPEAMDKYDEEAVRLCSVHDDMLLCLGLQRGIRYPSYVIPRGEPEHMLIKEELPGGNDSTACWKRPGHFKERTQFVRLAADNGWIPIV